MLYTWVKYFRPVGGESKTSATWRGSIAFSTWTLNRSAAAGSTKALPRAAKSMQAQGIAASAAPLGPAPSAALLGASADRLPVGVAEYSRACTR
ncbi:hypothetical protein FQZ97_893490 [compost metagenome]